MKYKRRELNDILINYAHHIGIEVEVELTDDDNFEDVAQFCKEMTDLRARFDKEFAEFIDGYNEGDDLREKKDFEKFFLKDPMRYAKDAGMPDDYRFEAYDSWCQTIHCRFTVRDGNCGLWLEEPHMCLYVTKVCIDPMDDAEGQTPQLCVRTRGWFDWPLEVKE